MKKKSIAALIVFIPIILYIFYIQNNKQKNDSFLEEVSKNRAEKEVFMKTANSSPFVNNQAAYHPLNYYEPDPAFKVNAKVTKFSEVKYLNIGESDGSTKRYLKFAKLNFKIKGTPQELLVLKPTGFGQMNVLFTAFADETSGKETYGGGRYLDLSFKNAKSIMLDFNLAYNPYCAYNEGFACPLPPRENILTIGIEAGEKNYK